MSALILLLLAVCLALLILEDRQVRRDRSELVHVVYVNGIRGKSTVTRMIDRGPAGGRVEGVLQDHRHRAYGYRGGRNGRPLVRRGRANISEQVRVLHRAVREGAQILVIECMAVDPALQAVSQHRMVPGGHRSHHQCPAGPHCGDGAHAGGDLRLPLQHNPLEWDPVHGRRSVPGPASDQRTQKKLPGGAGPAGQRPADFDFPENVALALAVCREIGVDRDRALEGILRYQPDPYALSLFRLPSGAAFVNAMSVNDPQSTQLDYHRVAGRPGMVGRRLVLLINNRPDRGYRTEHMMMVARGLEPEEIWLIGASQRAVRRTLRHILPDTPVRLFPGAEALPLDSRGADTMIFAAGNLAGPGKALMERVRKEGEQSVL